MSNDTINQEAKAVASETAPETKTLQAVIFDMSLNSEGDHDSAKLAQYFDKGIKNAPSLKLVFDSNPFIGINGQVNFNTSTISQIADRRIKALIDDENVKYTFTHRALKDGGVFLIEKRTKLKVGDKVETQTSKVHKRIEYRKNEDSTFRILNLIPDCLFAKALEESLTIISGNDFKQLIIDPILSHYRGFTFKSKSRYAFAKMNNSEQNELMNFCNEFINSTIPNFESNKLIYVEGETSQSEISHAQKSIKNTIGEMYDSLHLEMDKMRDTPTENRREKALSKINEMIETVNNFRSLLQMKSDLNMIKLAELDKELQDMITETKKLEVKEINRNRPSRTKVKLQEAKAVIENQQSELEKLKAELAALKLLQAKKDSKAKK